MSALERFTGFWKYRVQHLFDLGQVKPPAPLTITRMASFGEYESYTRSMADEYTRRKERERALQKPSDFFSVQGFCFVCRRPVAFGVDGRHGLMDPDGRSIPNWRENLVCPICRLNNRMRAAIHVLHDLCSPKPDSAFYITEQTTPLYRRLNAMFPDVIGSEYWVADLPAKSGKTKGLRNEDLTRLSFADRQFDFVLSFDVFEHIPDYRKAFRECRRVLKPNGVLFFSIPFVLHSADHCVRAEIGLDGALVHLMPPEFHGDPMQKDGCFCFRHFGWACLEELRQEGFSESVACLYWSEAFGYLGGEQILFMAKA